MKKTNGFWVLAALCLPAAIGWTGCAGPTDSEKTTPPQARLRLRYEVNGAGDNFVNTAPADGKTYTAVTVVNGGRFETVNGLSVFNTGGEFSGSRDAIPWFAGNSWPNYTNVGYVDLGAAAGDSAGWSACEKVST